VQRDRAAHHEAADHQRVGVAGIAFDEVGQPRHAALAGPVLEFDALDQAQGLQRRGHRLGGLVPAAAGIGRHQQAQLRARRRRRQRRGARGGRERRRGGAAQHEAASVDHRRAPWMRHPHR
jgi:hypothetical protein